MKEVTKEQLEAARKIVLYPAKTLSSSPDMITDDMFTPALQLKIDEMIDVMKKLKAYGVAGPQIGYDYTVFVCWLSAREEEDILVMINPQEVLDYYGGRCTFDENVEGCLSLPGISGVVRRKENIHMRWLDRDGFEKEAVFQGWDARVVQHELDHLYGELIHEKFNQVDKMANRKKIEQLWINAGILPRRLKKRGYVIKNATIQDIS